MTGDSTACWHFIELKALLHNMFRGNSANSVNSSSSAYGAYGAYGAADACAAWLACIVGIANRAWIVRGLSPDGQCPGQLKSELGPIVRQGEATRQPALG